MEFGEKLQDALDSVRSRYSRSVDGSCNNCGTSEGSMISDRKNEWSLCQTCMNDPEVLDLANEGDLDG